MTARGFDESVSLLRRFQATIARRDVLPQGVLRRNVTEYALVCHVNNITALLAAENWEAVPIFVARAAEHMAQFPDTEQTRDWRSWVVAYLAHVVDHLARHVRGVEFDAQRIPPSILAAGPQLLPI